MSRNYKFHNPEEYVYSSAVDYADQKGFIDDVLVFRMLNHHTKGFVRQRGILFYPNRVFNFFSNLSFSSRY